MNKEFNRYKVTIAGESYFLVSDESEEHIRSVARYVDEQIRSVAQAGHIDDIKRVAVLVALQCASKMMVNERSASDVAKTSEQLVELVSKQLEQLQAVSQA